MIFNKSDNGSEELKDLLGFIDSSSNFNRWKTWIELSVRQITSLVGKEVYKLADDHYHTEQYIPHNPGIPDSESNQTPTPTDLLVRKIQLANALFAYVRLLPSLDAGHSPSGRKKSVGDTEKSLTAIEAYKDESNILNLAYEAMEDLILFLEENNITAWVNSPLRKLTRELLVQDYNTFNLYYKIDSIRMFYTLLPMMREVQDDLITPTITRARVDAILAAIKKTDPTDEEKALIDLLNQHISRPMVLATISLGLQRLPVEMIPEGLVQTQITGNVKEKLIASEKAVQAMVTRLEASVKQKMSALQDHIAILDGATAQERYVTPPTAKDTIKGFTIN